MKKLAVFCGSSSGASSIYIEEAKKTWKRTSEAKHCISLWWS